MFFSLKNGGKVHYFISKYNFLKYKIFKISLKIFNMIYLFFLKLNNLFSSSVLSGFLFNQNF